MYYSWPSFLRSGSLIMTPEQIQQAISEVNDQESFIQRLLVQTLDWPIPEIVTDVEDMAVEWTDDELNALLGQIGFKLVSLLLCGLIGMILQRPNKQL